MNKRSVKQMNESNKKQGSDGHNHVNNTFEKEFTWLLQSISLEDLEKNEQLRKVATILIKLFNHHERKQAEETEKKMWVPHIFEKDGLFAKEYRLAFLQYQDGVEVQQFLVHPFYGLLDEEKLMLLEDHGIRWTFDCKYSLVDTKLSPYPYASLESLLQRSQETKNVENNNRKGEII